MRIFHETTLRRAIFACVSSFALMMTVGCQYDKGGTTPVPAHLHDESIEYFPTTPKFKLSKEAEELRAAKEAEAKPDAKPNTAPKYQIQNHIQK